MFFKRVQRATLKYKYSAGQGVLPAHQLSTRQKPESSTNPMERLKAFSSIRQHGGRGLQLRTSSPGKLKYVDSIRRHPLQQSKSTNDMSSSPRHMENIQEQNVDSEDCPDPNRQIA